MQELLNTQFGYNCFRGGQEELIAAILDRQDALGIMPTGAGKSICFQLPALMLPGITLVISPLISLMKDQVGALIQSGVAAAYINSSLSPRQTELALYNAAIGKYKLIYVAPERLLSPDFLSFAQGAEISMLTVDEAHCISQWGQDFRPSYAQIPQFIRSLPRKPIVSAFTATATLRVREDIVRLLCLQAPKILVTGFDRQNLYFEVQAPKKKPEALLAFLRPRYEANGIVYCATRKGVEEVCQMLLEAGFSATRYHAGLPDSERHRNQDDFLYDRAQIMVATNAFGMGIDKSNVSFVVHYNMPKDIESYYQEAGRAGRDGSGADCLLLYSGQDVRTNQWLIENSKDMRGLAVETEQLLKEGDYHRLRQMTFYATTNDCLRAFILRYFGEAPSAYCGHCGSCNTNFETVDITEDAQKILSCVRRMQGRFGATLVIDVLRGSKNGRIRQLGFDKLSTHGISDKSAPTLRAILDFLVQNGYLDKSAEQYAVLSAGKRSGELLAEGVCLHMKLAKERKVELEKKSGKTSGAANPPPERQPLYQALRSLRQKIAQQQAVPAYVVFSDSTLTDMCRKLPQNDAQLLTVSGVGAAKLQRYGAAFLSLIATFCVEHAIEKRQEEAQPSPVSHAGKRTAPKDLILPDHDILSRVPIAQDPVSIRVLTASLNAVLKEAGCSFLTAVRTADWLLSEGYLQLSTLGETRTKAPTAQGFSIGITQEERSFANGVYCINLYSPDAQRFVLEHTSDALRFDKSRG